MKYRLYIEGGGNSASESAQFRKAWSEFFRKAGLSGKLPSIVRGGGRNRTFDQFKTAVANPKKNELPLLLVDSETAVAAEHSVWQHLGSKDNWDQPTGTDDRQAFLMVQVMETYFVADRSSLKRFFGSDFNADRIPQWPNLETIPKETVFNALADATRECITPYRKGKLSFELLAQVNPKIVANACPHAKDLLDTLKKRK